MTAHLLAEHAALTGGAGVADLSGRTLLEVAGADRAGFLHAFCTSDIKALQPGQSGEAFITSPQGKTLGHVLVFCQADRLLLDTSPGQGPGLAAHFAKYVISEDVQFAERTAEVGRLLVAGPRAEPLVRGRAAFRVPYVAAGWFVLVAAGDLPRLREQLVGQGAVACGPEAVEAARLEAGFPLFGRDVTAENLPQEVGRDAAAISFTKGCYLGQETVARLDALGHVNRRLVGLQFTGDAVPADGTPLCSGDKEVGRVTSAAWSPRLSAPLALGYVRTAQAKPGTPLVSPLGPVAVVALPAAAR